MTGRHRYQATLSGSAWTAGPVATFERIADARRWAEAHGTTADECAIVDLTRWAPRADHPDRGRPVVALHRRDTSGDGSGWFRATPPPLPVDDGRTIDRDPLADLR